MSIHGLGISITLPPSVARGSPWQPKSASRTRELPPLTGSTGSTFNALSDASPGDALKAAVEHVAGDHDSGAAELDDQLEALCSLRTEDALTHSVLSRLPSLSPSPQATSRLRSPRVELTTGERAAEPTVSRKRTVSHCCVQMPEMFLNRTSAGTRKFNASRVAFRHGTLDSASGSASPRGAGSSNASDSESNPSSPRTSVSHRRHRIAPGVLAPTASKKDAARFPSNGLPGGLTSHAPTGGRSSTGANTLRVVSPRAYLGQIEKSVSLASVLLQDYEELPKFRPCTWQDAAPELALCHRSSPQYPRQAGSSVGAASAMGRRSTQLRRNLNGVNKKLDAIIPAPTPSSGCCERSAAALSWAPPPSLTRFLAPIHQRACKGIAQSSSRIQMKIHL